jgi:pimeloyl-ACP methyl ester carboxylesterase
MPLHLKDDLFVYIPGLFTQWYPGYMKEIVAAMNALSFNTFVVKINTAGSQLENAHVVADAIMNLTLSYPDRKVVILGHSKGALDAATAFVLRPEIVPRISAFIAFQAPWGGSTIANDILSAYHRRAVSTAFIEKILNGNAHSLVGCMYAERKKWIANHPFPLGAFPTISVATYETSFKSLLKAPIDYIKLRYNELSDGCVATKDAIIPGTVLVELPGLDHFGPAYHGFPACCNHHDPLRMQMVLLNVLFHR